MLMFNHGVPPARPAVQSGGIPSRRFTRRSSPMSKPSPTTDSHPTAATLEQLREEIRRHDELYYQRARPEISDQEYDALLRKLLELEAAYPEWVTPDSPSRRVGGQPVEGHASVRHAVRMTSIDNTYDEAEVREFDARVRKLLGSDNFAFTCEPKID